MNKEIATFLESNYTSEKAEFLSGTIESIESVSDYDEDNLLLLLHDGNYLTMEAKPEIFERLIVDQCALIAKEIGIITKTDNLIILRQIIEFYAMVQESPDHIQNEALLANDLDNVDRLSSLISLYTGGDAFELSDSISKVSNSLINNLLQASLDEINKPEEFENMFTQEKIDLVASTVGPESSGMIEVMLMTNSLEGRQESLIAMKIDEIMIYFGEPDGTITAIKYILAIWMAVELSTKEPSELVASEFSQLCRKIWLDRFGTDASAFEREAKKYLGQKGVGQ